jgi:hypothetical protein
MSQVSESAMKIITLYLQRDISWLFSQGDAPAIALPSLSGIKLVHPIHYNHQSLSKLGLSDENTRTRPPLSINGDKWVVLASQLLFAVDEGQAIDTANFITTLAPKFLRALRYTSGQSWISRTITVATEGETASVSNFEFTLRKDPDNAAFISAQHVDLAVSWAKIHKIDKTIRESSFETYMEVLLDGIAAHQESDYLKAILYSAIACESVAAQQIDRAYDDLRKAPTKSTTHRFVKCKTPDGDVDKDPVFERLRSTEKGAFLSSLHELPLYLWSRSIQGEKPQLYRTAHALYKTRNKVAHLGGLTEESDKTLPITREGSKQAIDCAVQIFDWFNVNASHLAPWNDMRRVFMGIANDSRQESK